MSKKKTLHLLISGHVQGIGFRHFVRQKALECQLTGWVKNLLNGKIEIEAEGTEKDLACFIDYLQTGNGYSRIDQFNQNIIQSSANFSDFTIRY